MHCHDDDDDDGDDDDDDDDDDDRWESEGSARFRVEAHLQSRWAKLQPTDGEDFDDSDGDDLIVCQTS